MRTQGTESGDEQAPQEADEPTHTGTRPRIEADAEPLSPPLRQRKVRSSIRPSAFGRPPVGRPSQVPPAPEALRAPIDAPPAAGESPQARPVVPLASAPNEPIDVPSALPQHAPTSHKTDIEELLPISQAVKLLPRPPRLPTIEMPSDTAPGRRFPWLSLSVFAVMITASAGSLLRYSGLELPTSATDAPIHELSLTATIPAVAQAIPSTAAARASANKVPPRRPASNEREAVERIASGLWTEPERMRATLLAEGERALEADDQRLAEALFGRAYELDVGDARAEYGLARVRLAQHDLEGAEGWLLSAIAKQPREAKYRELHAELLDRADRHSEAELERALARSIANFAGATPTR